MTLNLGLGWARGPGTGLSADGLLVASCKKQGGRGGCLNCTDTLSQLDFDFYNPDIDCVSGYFNQFLNLV